MYPGSTVWYRSLSVKQVSDLSSLGFVINRLFMKLFKTNNIEIVELCQYQFGFEQELSYRKQIARQLHTQFVEGISVTLKSTLRVTQSHWKRNH